LCSQIHSSNGFEAACHMRQLADTCRHKTIIASQQHSFYHMS